MPAMYRVQKIFHNMHTQWREGGSKTESSNKSKVKEIWLICYFSTRPSRARANGEVDLHHFSETFSKLSETLSRPIDDMVWDVISPSQPSLIFFSILNLILCQTSERSERGEITTCKQKKAEERMKSALRRTLLDTLARADVAPLSWQNSRIMREILTRGVWLCHIRLDEIPLSTVLSTRQVYRC